LFKVDPKYEENERKYAEIKAEILGDDDSDDESGSDVETDDEEEQGQFRSQPVSVGLMSSRD
jgi:pre-mRNA-splicing factor CWC22